MCLSLALHSHQITSYEREAEIKAKQREFLSRACLQVVRLLVNMHETDFLLFTEFERKIAILALNSGLLNDRKDLF